VGKSRKDAGGIIFQPFYFSLCLTGGIAPKQKIQMPA
jgi:hypothetical protein